MTKKITYIEESGDLEAEIMTGAQLMDATTTVVRTIARDHKTDVVFAGDGAATNGQDVILPSIPLDAKITRRQALVTGGYANHESLHKLLTDFNKLKPRMKRWHSDGKTLTKHLANAIEDIRIERGGQVLYNGLPKSIDKTAREVNRQFIDKIYPQDPSIVEDFRKIGPVAVTWEGRKRLGYPDPSMAEALALLPDDIRKRVEKIVDQVMELPHGVKGMGRVDTAEAFGGSVDGAKLAERIATAYEKEMQKKWEKENEGKGKGSPGNGNGANGQGQSGDAQEQGSQGSGDAQGNGAGDGKGDGDAGKSATAADAGKDGDAGEGKGKPANGGDDGQGDSNTPGGGVGGGWSAEEFRDVEPVNAELGQALSQVLSEVVGNGGYRVLNPSDDVEIEVEIPKSYAASYRQRYQMVKNGIGPQVGTIRRKLERALVSKADTFWEGGKRAGRLDVRRNAAKIVQLEGNVFKQRAEDNVVNTALSVLVDMSGSMSEDRKIIIAQQATIAICEALDGMRVPLEVLGHNTFMSDRSRTAWGEVCGDEKALKSISRAENVRVNVFKEFDDPLSTSRAKLARMSNMTSGCNADGDAMLVAARRLMERREPRKVLLVLSDGQPAYKSLNRNIHQYTRDCVKWISEQGVIVAAIGVRSEYVSKYFDRYVVCWDMDSFAKDYIGVVANLLLGGGAAGSDLMASGVRRGGRL